MDCWDCVHQYIGIMHSQWVQGCSASQQYCSFLPDEEDENEEENAEEPTLGTDEENSGSEDEVFDDSVCPKST